MTKSLLPKLFDRPIAFHRSLVPIAGVTGAVMLSQAIYWSLRLPDDRDGWFYKTRDEWTEETGLTRREQETARKKLKRVKIIEEKRKGMSPILWYKINWSELEKWLVTYYTQGRKAPTRKGGKRPTILYTENTTYIEKSKKIHKPQPEANQTSELSPDLQAHLQKRAVSRTKKRIRKENYGKIPPYIDIEKESGVELKNLEKDYRVMITQPMTKEYESFLNWLKSIKKPTVYHPETEKNWNRIRKTFTVEQIKCAVRIALLDSFWKKHFNFNTFIRPYNYNGEPQDNVASFYQTEAEANIDIITIRQHMEHEIEHVNVETCKYCVQQKKYELKN